MIRKLAKKLFNRKKEPQRIDDLNRAVDALIETAQYIVPEKRFAAFTVVVQTLYKDHRVYRYHPCNRKKQEA